MGIKKFLALVQETLGLDELKKASKKESVKVLLKKLYAKKDAIDKSLKSKVNKKSKKELQEEKEIIVFQIKKGKAILEKLNLQKDKNGK